MNEERDELLSIYSDVHKEVYGYRPLSWEQIDSMSKDRLEQAIDEMVASTRA